MSKMPAPKKLLDRAAPAGLTASQRKTALETTLETLRNQNRLGIHIAEYPNMEPIAFALPHGSWGYFQVMPAADIDSKLKEGNAYLISTSLLPDRSCQNSMIPYGVSKNDVGIYGYLLNLAQDQPHPPRIVLAHNSTANSDNDGFDKKYIHYFDLKCGNLHASLNANARHLFAEHVGEEPTGTPEYKKAWEAAVGKEGSAISNSMLDALATLKHSEAATLNTRDRRMSFNEVLLAAAKDHIAAITIPYYTDEQAEDWYKPIAKLTAAMAGMQHLQIGADLPVVFYHVDSGPINVAKRGSCEYVAQGRQEFINTAFEAIEELQKHQRLGRYKMSLFHINSHRYKQLIDEVRSIFKIDMEHPIEPQKECARHLLAVEQQGTGANLRE